MKPESFCIPQLNEKIPKNSENSGNFCTNLIEAFGPDAVLGPHKDAKDVGLCRGFQSKICLISPDWQNKSPSLVEQFIAKISSQLSLLESGVMKEDDTTSQSFDSEQFIRSVEEGVKMGHNAEVKWYRLLQKYKVTDIPIPKIYFMKEFTAEDPLKGHIVMEYVTGGLQYHVFDNLEPNLMLQPLRALAKLQALTAKFTDDERVAVKTNALASVLSTFAESSAIESLFATMRFVGGEALKESIDRAEAVKNEVCDLSIMDTLCEKLGMKPVFCHGDLWSNNLIWKETENGSVELAAIIDFQTAHLGCPALDIVRLFCGCMSGKDRRDSWEMLLEKFYSMLEEELENQDMPYTLEMLKLSYRRYFPLGAFLMVPMIASMAKVMLAGDDVEQKAKVESVVHEKMGCLLDDVVEFHEHEKRSRSA
ncbi:hypothetical protein Q1695_004288 [Nippostrongylus brasiliensis]|nr:hypothetical protein Q1695_004288 [Nippostrongylus brasiliensis]